MAMKLYARQAKNKALEADAFEIRLRAERRLGEMLATQPKAEGTRGQLIGRGVIGGFPKNPPISFNAAGIDKNLANRARKLNALSEKEFGTLVAEGRDDVQRSVERSFLSKVNRAEKHKKIAGLAKARAIHLGPFPLIYADPPWEMGAFWGKG